MSDFNVFRRFSAFLPPVTGAPSDDLYTGDSTMKKDNATSGDDDKASCHPTPVVDNTATEPRALDSSKRPREADAPHTASGGDGEDDDDPSNPHRPSPKRIHYTDLNTEAREQADSINARYPPIGLITLVDNEIGDYSPPLNLFQGRTFADAQCGRTSHCLNVSQLTYLSAFSNGMLRRGKLRRYFDAISRDSLSGVSRVC